MVNRIPAYMQESPRYINAVDYGIVGDGSEQQAKVQSMLDLVPDGSVVYFPAGDYRVGGTVRTTGKNIHLKGSPNTRFILTGEVNVPIFEFLGSWAGMWDISSYESTVSYVIPNDITPPNTPGSTQVTKITLASVPTGLKRYDIVKIVSENSIPDNITHRRRGEFAVVAGVEGNIVYLTTRLRKGGIS